MFQISDVHIPACITTYDAAVRLHTKRRPWRGGGDDNIRPLGGRRQRWLTIRRDDNGDLVARMYQTDIIRWRPDGAIALMPFTTQGTSRVVNTLLRGTGCYAMYTGPLGPCLWLDHYAPRDAATIVRMNACGATVVQVDPQTKRFDRHAEEAPVMPFRRYTLDRAATRALYATYNLTGFRAWLAAWHALTPEDTTHPYIYRNAMMAAGDWAVGGPHAVARARGGVSDCDVWGAEVSPWDDTGRGRDAAEIAVAAASRGHSDHPARSPVPRRVPQHGADAPAVPHVHPVRLQPITHPRLRRL